ncbi:MarR family winged helix-turn-helix transcriptional regulator [Ottowia oryzae]
MPTSAATAQPTPAPQLLLDHQLCFSLYAASLAMTRRYQPLLAELGLTYPQYIALLALWEHDDVTVSALGDRLALDSGTLTPLLKRMETSGWVTRERDAADERRVRVRLTPAGRALRERAQHIPTSLLAGSGVTATQVRQLTAELQALRQRLEG